LWKCIASSTGSYSWIVEILRTVFIADPEIAWDFSEDAGTLMGGVTELSLKPWREAALRRWMEDAEFGPEALGNYAMIFEKTGGWGMLVHALGEACRGCPHNWLAREAGGIPSELAVRPPLGELLRFAQCRATGLETDGGFRCPHKLG
jgi:hypothetical protein